MSSTTALAAIFNLNHPAHVLHSGWFLLSVPNLIVIILMFVVFFAALLLPFPGRANRRENAS